MRIFFLGILVLLSACVTGNHYVLPPNGGVLIIPGEPIWLSGVQTKDSLNPELTAKYPLPKSTEHMEVVNAGYWISFQNAEMQATYEYTLNVSKSFQNKVYTRVILENPLDPAAPFQYEHYLLPVEEATRAIHGPVFGIQMGKSYNLTFEVYADTQRTVLLERVTQKVVASFDNSSGCVELESSLRPILLVSNDLSGKPIPTEKVIWPCRRRR